jgi:hypothetical protein
MPSRLVIFAILALVALGLAVLVDVARGGSRRRLAPVVHPSTGNSMPIDSHVRVAAWIHIVMGALGVCVLAILGLMAGAFGAVLGASVHGHDEGLVLGAIAGFGTLLFLFLMAFPALEIIGGVLLLRGSPVGRVLTIIFSILSLLNFPIGTAAGGYSLWALLREVPQPHPMPANVQSY